MPVPVDKPGQVFLSISAEVYLLQLNILTQPIITTCGYDSILPESLLCAFGRDGCIRKIYR